MSSPIIVVEELGKKYSLSHQGAGPRYKTLRETVAARAKGLFQRSESKNSHRNSSRREEFWALKGLSFEVRQGEVLGVIGRNGAGKSTLLKLLSRITDPTTGRIRLRGRVACLLEVGTGFHPELTGRENIFLNGAILGMHRHEISRKFDEIVAFAEVEQFLDTPVKRYSSGMYVRLAFAVAAHLEPEILIVDEVLAVGDAAFQKKCLGKMSEVARAGRTILFVSHNMAAMRALTQRSIYLKGGVIAADGPTSTVHDVYMRDISTDRRDEDLSVQRRQSELHGTKVRFLRVRPSTDSTCSFMQAEDLVFEVTLQAHARLDDLFIGFTISDISGSPIMTGFTDNVINLESGQVTQYRLAVIDARLSPGEYFLHLSVAAGDLYSARLIYDLVKPATEFSVRAEGYDGRPLYQWRAEAYGATVHPTGSTMVTLAREASYASSLT